MILKKNGTVWAIGYNGAGQLGDRISVAKAPVDTEQNIKSWYSGYSYTVIIKTDGTKLIGNFYKKEK